MAGRKKSGADSLHNLLHRTHRLRIKDRSASARELIPIKADVAEQEECPLTAAGRAKRTSASLEPIAMNTTRLALILYIIAAPTLAGIAMTAVLATPHYQTSWLLAAALAGFLAAAPAAWLGARNINAKRR